MFTRRCIVFVALLSVVGCSLDSQTVPGLTGPSELGLSLAVSASPDILNQDGASQSQVTVTARDANGAPARNVSMRVDILLGGSPSDFGTIGTRTVSTNSDGRATVTYTAPPGPPATATFDTTVQVAFTPIGTNFANSVGRTVDIRLMRPGSIAVPSTDLRPAFTFSPGTPKIGDSVVFDASTSTVNAGRTITAYQWSFGDGSTGSGKLTNHTFTEPGTFAVKLTITDDLGRTASASQTMSLGSNLPTANFVVSPTDAMVGESVVFNAKSSTAGLGRRIVTYEWDFGDRNTDFGETTYHQFAAARTYTVVLTVRDDLGQSASTSTTVTVSDIQASFTVSPSDPVAGTSVSFNASGSKVAAGVTIASYGWDFGDGGTSASGPSASHPYAAAGSYAVTLTIQDSNGRTASASKTVTVKAP